MTEEKTDLTQVYLGEPMRLAGVTYRSVGNLSSKKSLAIVNCFYTLEEGSRA